MILCLGETPGGFYDVGCCCCCFLHWRFLRFQATFSCNHHSTLASQAREGSHQLWSLPWLLSFVLLLPGLFVIVLPRVQQFWVGIFYPQEIFTWRSFPTFLTSLVTQMDAGTPYARASSVPTLTKLSLPADAWTWTTHIVVTRPKIRRVKIKLLNMFRLLKVIRKDYKKTLNKAWCTA